MFADAAGYYAVEMVKFRVHIDGNTMITDPFPQPDTDCCNLGFPAVALINPDSDPAFAPPAGDVESPECPADPVFERMNTVAHIAPPYTQIQHGVGNALSGAVIGVLSAPARLKYRKSVRFRQISGIGTGTGGVDCRMFGQPDTFAGAVQTYIGDAFFHKPDCIRVLNGSVGKNPFG